MLIKKIIKVCSFVLIGTSSAYASTATDNFKASANVEKTCKIYMPDIHLGVINTNEIVASTEGQYKIYEAFMQVQCSKATAYNVGGDVAKKIESPVTPGHYYNYVFPMRHVEIPEEKEYFGFRFRLGNNAESSLLGNGGVSETGAKTYTIPGVGNGDVQQLPIYLQFYVYKHLRQGNYAATHNFYVNF